MTRPIGRCIGCFHDFANGPCGGCGAEPGPYDNPPLIGFDGLPVPCQHRGGEGRAQAGSRCYRHVETAQCDGWCHDEGIGDCERCESGDERMCDDCTAYVAEAAS